MSENLIKCANCNVVISEVLAFIRNKHDVMDNESLVRICQSAFSEEEIDEAKKGEYFRNSGPIGPPHVTSELTADANGRTTCDVTAASHGNNNIMSAPTNNQNNDLFNKPAYSALFHSPAINKVVPAAPRLCKTSDVIALKETWLWPHELTYLSSLDDNFTYTGKSSMDTTMGVVKGRPHGGVALCMITVKCCCFLCICHSIIVKVIASLNSVNV
ncbi:unnamed protein product [Danaus chrysippus]|uniref:(African queen) hypothetical protein n=1 Tax=Danaus chrysippus TaxID=151541 RepID=A0A8J2ME39_9NEOP|nr:unnamed protein product [Danaus chrysippus]